MSRSYCPHDVLPNKRERQTTIEDAYNNWRRVHTVRMYVNGRLSQIEHLRVDPLGGYIARTPVSFRYDKRTQYLDRACTAKTQCFVEWIRTSRPKQAGAATPDEKT